MLCADEERLKESVYVRRSNYVEDLIAPLKAYVSYMLHSNVLQVFHPSSNSVSIVWPTNKLTS